MDTKKLGFDTKTVHAGASHDQYGSAVTPIYQTSTFAFDSAQNGADRFAGKADGFIYTRIGNPTIRALEKNIAELENGFDGVATALKGREATLRPLTYAHWGDPVIHQALNGLDGLFFIPPAEAVPTVRRVISSWASSDSSVK